MPGGDLSAPACGQPYDGHSGHGTERGTERGPGSRSIVQGALCPEQLSLLYRRVRHAPSCNCCRQQIPIPLQAALRCAPATLLSTLQYPRKPQELEGILAGWLRTAESRPSPTYKTRRTTA